MHRHAPRDEQWVRVQPPDVVVVVVAVVVGVVDLDGDGDVEVDATMDEFTKKLRPRAADTRDMLGFNVWTSINERSNSSPSSTTSSTCCHEATPIAQTN